MLVKRFLLVAEIFEFERGANEGETFMPCHEKPMGLFHPQISQVDLKVDQRSPAVQKRRS